MRKHIPVHEIQAGSRVYVLPRDHSTPRGPKLDSIPKEGMTVRVDDYVFGAIQRGALIAYGPDEAAEPAAPAAPELAPAEEVP